MLIVTASCAAGNSTRSSATCWRKRSSQLSACSKLVPGSSTANSSPPKRAKVSPSRTCAMQARASRRSTSSPARWPCWSLTALKLSMSISATEYAVRSRRLRSTSASRRSMKCRRLEAPVRWSVMLMMRSCSCAWSSRSSRLKLWKDMVGAISSGQPIVMIQADSGISMPSTTACTKPLIASDSTIEISVTLVTTGPRP